MYKPKAPFRSRRRRGRTFNTRNDRANVDSGGSREGLQRALGLETRAERDARLRREQRDYEEGLLSELRRYREKEALEDEVRRQSPGGEQEESCGWAPGVVEGGARPHDPVIPGGEEGQPHQADGVEAGEWRVLYESGLPQSDDGEFYQIGIRFGRGGFT